MSIPSKPEESETEKSVSEAPEQTDAEKAASALHMAEIHRQNIAMEQANDMLHWRQQGSRLLGFFDD